MVEYLERTPWVARRDESAGEPYLWSVYDADNQILFFGMDEPVARLFAAAPELLAALKAVVAISMRKHIAWDAALAAMAKAEPPALASES